MRGGTFTIVISLLLLCTACSEVIDLRVDSGVSRLLVYGRLTSGLEGNIIELARTSTNEAGQQPVNGARITLVAGNGARGEYTGIDNGKYQLDNNQIIGVPGESYHIEIALSNGQQYRSEPAIMPASAAQDILDFESKTATITLQNGTSVRRNVVELYNRTEIADPDRDFYLKWDLVETFLFPERPKMVNVPDPPPQWCYITNDLEGQSIFLYNGKDLKNTEIARRKMTTRPVNSDLVSEYYFQVVQSSITTDAYRFWNEIEQVSNVKGSIFDRPLAAVSSNVFNVENPNEQVLGYFMVASADTTRILLRAEDLPFDIRVPCPVTGPAAPECLECLILDNSVKVKPHFVD